MMSLPLFYFLASEGNKDSQIFIAKRRRKYALHIYFFIYMV